MMKLKLTGIDETFNVADATTANSLVLNFPAIYDVDTFREKLADTSLRHFEFLDSAGNVAGRYDNYTFTGDVSYSVKDGIYTAKYFLRKKTDIEIRLDALEAGQELQDGAIDELAQIAGGGK